MKALVASVMRHLPVQVRRVRVWRDKAYVAIGGGGWDEDDALDAKWPSRLQEVRSRSNGMKMALDLTDWCQRRSYFTGRFYQEDLEDLLSALLAPECNFVDIGANIGLVTLHAASITKKIWSFEPNPDVYARLVKHLEMNRLRTDRAFNIGLGDRDSTLTLKLHGRHTGKATLVDQGKPAERVVEVQVRRGDEVLPAFAEPTVFKIDVEGFEVPVLRGLGDLLRGDVAVVIEVSPSWLKAAGTSAEELHELLGQYGLAAYRFELVESRFRRQLRIEPLTDPLDQQQYDCLFMRPTSVFAKRLTIVHTIT